MELNLPGIGTVCHVTGEAFVEDERITSLLVRSEAEDTIIRFDVKMGSLEDFEAPGKIACRWIQTFKPRVAADNPERDLKLTAENLFLTLADPGNELNEEDSRLVQFLALMMERKRLIKPKGVSADGIKTIYEHRGTKGRYEVPMDDLNPAFFIAVQEQLSVLVGFPDNDSSESSEEKGSSGPSDGPAT
jgi:hypothetical protein